MMKKDTLIKQHDIQDCGAACLASISAHYGLKMPIAKIRQLSHTDIRGTNVLGMVQGLEKMGFNAKGVKGGADVLSDIPLPAIAHIVTKEHYHHYAVIYKVSNTSKSPKGGKIEVMDQPLEKLKNTPSRNFPRFGQAYSSLWKPMNTLSKGTKKQAFTKDSIILFNHIRAF